MNRYKGIGSLGVSVGPPYKSCDPYIMMGPKDDPAHRPEPSYVNSHDPTADPILGQTPGSGYRLGGEARNKLRTEQILSLCKRKCPIGYEELLSWVQREIGIKRDLAKSHLVILHDTKEIKIDTTTGKVYLWEGD